MLSVDGTLILQIANFLVLLVVLNAILFKPIRKILAEREAQMMSQQKAIDDYVARAEQNGKEIEEGKVNARKEGYASRELLKSQALEEQKGILREAGTAVEQKLDAAKKEIEAKMTAAREALEEQIAGFSKELAQKILGRSIQ